MKRGSRRIATSSSGPRCRPTVRVSPIVSIADGHATVARAQSRDRSGQRRAHRSAHRATGLVAGRRTTDLDGHGAARRGVRDVRSTGSYANLVSSRHAESAWSPDGKTIALADIPPERHRAGRRTTAIPIEPAIATPICSARQSGSCGRSTRRRRPTAHSPNKQARRRRPIARGATPTRSIRSGIAPPRSTTPRATRRRGARGGRRSSAKLRPAAIAATSDDELDAVIHELVRQHPPYRQSATGRAAVSSAHPVATAAGVEMLAKGGNVVDAAVAVSFALGVVEPDASGPGGYGQILIYKKGMERPELIEFMTRVPEDAGLSNTSLLQNGRLPDGGPVVANVPGTVAAMRLAWEKYGSKKIPWADLLQPAIRAARNGYVVSEGLATTLATEREQFLKYEGSRALFFRDGQPLHAGDTLKNPDLAWTLEQIAKDGADALYKGEVASPDGRRPSRARQRDEVERSRAVLCRRARAGGEHLSWLHTLLERAACVGRSGARRQVESARAVSVSEAVRRRRGDVARDDRRVAAHAVDTKSDRRSEPVADDDRAVHGQRHGARSVGVLRSEGGDQPAGIARRHARVRQTGYEDGDRSSSRVRRSAARMDTTRISRRAAARPERRRTSPPTPTGTSSPRRRRSARGAAISTSRRD